MDPLSLLGRAVLVFLLLGVTLWLVRRSDGMKKLRRTETPLEVLGSARLGKGASVALVRIGDADYALGVTDQAVSLLTEAELAEEEEAEAEPKPARSGFPAALQAQLGLLTRRGHGSRLEATQDAAPQPSVDAPAPAADEEFQQLLAAATAPVDRTGGAPADAPGPLSAQLKEVLMAAEAEVDASHASDAALAPALPARSTGARGARGPRARARAAGEQVQPAALRTGQRRAARRPRAVAADHSAAA